MLRRNCRCLLLYGLNMGTGTRMNLVNKSVSRATLLFATLHRRETICCLPSGTRHLLVCLPHYGLRPVRLDRLRICPLQCRQRQQNISLGCVHKAGLSFAKIPNCGGQQRSLFSLSWTQSIAKETNKSRCPTHSEG